MATTLAYVEAIGQRDVSRLQDLLHPNFRVTANGFPSPKDFTLIDKDSYLQLMKDKRIGGEPYVVQIEQLGLHEISGMVQATLRGSKSVMKIFLSLLQVPSGEWQIVANVPEIIR